MYVHHKGLNNHIFTEVKEGFDKKGLVIVDKEFSHMFEFTTEYNESHVIVDYEEFRRLGGKFRLISVSSR